MALDRVLLVEDAKTTQTIVQHTLRDLAEVTCASSIAEGKEQLRTNQFELLIFDVNLPDGNGFELCQEVRKNEDYRDVPIVFLTSQSEIADLERGFEIGADDYVFKPIEPKEFVARIKSKLKRRVPMTAQGSFKKANFKVDSSQSKIFVKAKNSDYRDLELTPNEFKLFSHFLKNENKTFSRDELISALWGTQVHISGHTIDTHISAVRKKIGEYGPCLKSVFKKGYCFSLK